MTQDSMHTNANNHNFSIWNSTNDIINDCKKKYRPNSWKSCRKKPVPEYGKGHFLSGPKVYDKNSQAKKKKKKKKKKIYIGTK